MISSVPDHFHLVYGKRAVKRPSSGTWRSSALSFVRKLVYAFMPAFRYQLCDD